MEDKLICRKCKHSIDDSDKFCNNCGTEVQLENICSKCNKKNEIESKFCSDCGERLKVKSQEIPGNKESFNSFGNDIIPPNIFTSKKENKEDSKTWMYDDRGETKGFYSFDEIKKLISEGIINENTLISKDKGNKWEWPKVYFNIESLNQRYSQIKTPIQTTNTVQNWYYNDSGAKKGPFTESEMVSRINTGELKYGQLVFKDGNLNWITIEQSELKKDIHTPPPLVGSAVSNGSIWWVAFAPLISLLITIFIMDFSINQYYKTNNIDWEQFYKFLRDWNIIIYLIVNLILVSIDQSKLKKAGHWSVPI